MAVGHDIAEDTQPIGLEGGEIEHVSEFSYLGSSIAANGRIDDEINRRIAIALKHLAHYAKLSLRMIICPLPPKGCYIRPVSCQGCSKESVAISGLCVVSAALRRVLVYQACVLSGLL